MRSDRGRLLADGVHRRCGWSNMPTPGRNDFMQFGLSPRTSPIYWLWGNPLLPARFARVLVGDDVFGRGICDWVCHRDFLSDRESVVFDGGGVARTTARGAIHGRDQFHRTFWAGTRSGISFRTCADRCGTVGRVAAPPLAVLG